MIFLVIARDGILYVIDLKQSFLFPLQFLLARLFLYLRPGPLSLGNTKALANSLLTSRIVIRCTISTGM